MKKSCLVVYVGCGYAENCMDYTGSYSYSTDMRENICNHREKVFSYLEKNNYNIDFLLLTNKHEKYDDFVSEYNALKIDYIDINDKDIDCLYHYYFNIRVLQGHCWGPGGFKSGGRLLKLDSPLPKFDLYVFIRSDLFFKKNIEELNIDFEKLNYLWAETDHKFFSDRDNFIKTYGSEMYFWNEHNRVSGCSFLISPYKFVNLVTRYLWADHLSLFLMLKDLNPIFTINDVNIMCGLEHSYVSDATNFDNPIFKFNKKNFIT